MPAIQRTILRERVREELARRLLHCELTPGDRVNETTLAEELGVSQTPVREALLGLERDGLLDSRPGRGFTARSLSVEEVQEVYPLLGCLESFALDISGIPDEPTLDKLEQLNDKLANPTVSPRQAYEIDVEWHGRLTAGCTNSWLNDMLRRLKTVIARYEFAYMSEHGNVTQSSNLHQKIIVALRFDELDQAKAALCENWLASIEPIREWLKARDLPDGH